MHILFPAINCKTTIVKGTPEVLRPLIGLAPQVEGDSAIPARPY